MSRFANPAATERFVLGPCECPGTPHDEDWMALRSELGADDMVKLEQDEPYERMKLLVRGWNLLGDDGQVAPITDEYLGRLYLDMFPAINAWLTANAKTSSLPNASGALSQHGSRGSASRIRTTPKRR